MFIYMWSDSILMIIFNPYVVCHSNDTNVSFYKLTFINVKDEELFLSRSNNTKALDYYGINTIRGDSISVEFVSITHPWIYILNE
jgi:hypothetical protein